MSRGEAALRDGVSDNLLDCITGLFLEHGYLVVFLGAAGDNLGIPATGDAVVFAGGWLSNTGHAAVGLVMLVAALGALLADNASYWAGRVGGRALVGRVLEHRLLSRLVSAGRVRRAEGYFETHSGKTVLMGRFTPGMCGPTPLFAGISRMPYPRFAAFNAGAIAAWAAAYSLAGYVFGEYWEELLLAARSLGFGLLALAALALAAYALSRRRSRDARRKRARADADGDGPAEGGQV